jgi:hypothetical protein
MPLGNLIKQCGNGQVPGVKQRWYYAIKGDITTFATATGGSNYGDDKVLDQAFTLAAGKKWFEIDVLVNSGDVVDTIVGETGGRGVENGIPFFVPDYAKEQRKFLDDMVTYDGCLIFMVPSKAGQLSVVGDLENPCFVETGVGGVGGAETTKVGVALRLKAATGKSCPIYTGAVDLTA